MSIEEISKKLQVFIDYLIMEGITAEVIYEKKGLEQQEISRLWKKIKGIVGTIWEPEYVANETSKEMLEERVIRGGIMETSLRQFVSEYPHQVITTLTWCGHLLIDSEKSQFYCKVKNLNPERKFLF